MPATDAPAWAFEPGTVLALAGPAVLGPSGVVAVLTDPADGPAVARAPAMLALLRRFVNLRTAVDYPEVAADAAALIDALEREEDAIVD